MLYELFYALLIDSARIALESKQYIMYMHFFPLLERIGNGPGKYVYNLWPDSIMVANMSRVLSGTGSCFIWSVFFLCGQEYFGFLSHMSSFSEFIFVPICFDILFCQARPCVE